MNASTDWLPPLVLFEEYDGNWEAYLEAVYAVFVGDFVDSKPAFPHRRVALKRYPIEAGREATFWHMVSTGRDEADRLVDIRRCERIPWPRRIIDAVSTARVLCWWNTRHAARGKAERIVLAVPDFSYVVILEDRGDFVIPWTAYLVAERHRRRKLEKEFRAAPKKLGPLPTNGSGSVTPSTHGG